MSTDFSGVTFQQQKISPSDDALIRRKLLADGILYGCDMSYSGTTLTMAAGQLMICGRQIRHPAAQNWAVVDATSGYARLVLTVDLTRTSTKDTFDQVLDTIEYASSLDGFTALETSDINISGTRYQVVLCVVSLGTGGITGITDKLQSIEAAGGGGLNLRVLGGTSAPQNPKENDIWIQIDSTNFEWAFVAAGASVANRAGRVWIKLGNGNADEFQILKKSTPAKQVWLSPIGCVVGDGSTWRSLNAYLYQNGAWVQFSGAFSARINVVYPAGSTCTISNGSKKYTAPSTGGYWECDVDSAGTWTVTATNGPQSASQSVSITASGQTAGVTLAYDYKIFNAGGVADYSGGWTIPEPYGSKVESDGIKLYTASSWQGCQVFTSAPFDVTKYSKLNINVSAYNSARPEASFGVSSGKPNNNMWNGDFTNKKNCAAVQSIKGTGVISLDISSLSGNYYFWIGQDGATWDGAGFTVVTVWLT